MLRKPFRKNGRGQKKDRIGRSGLRLRLSHKGRNHLFVFFVVFLEFFIVKIQIIEFIIAELIAQIIIPEFVFIDIVGFLIIDHGTGGNQGSALGTAAVFGFHKLFIDLNVAVRANYYHFLFSFFVQDPV